MTGPMGALGQDLKAQTMYRQMFLIARNSTFNRSSKVSVFLIDDIPVVPPQGACAKCEFIKLG